MTRRIERQTVQNCCGLSSRNQDEVKPQTLIGDVTLIV